MMEFKTNRIKQLLFTSMIVFFIPFVSNATGGACSSHGGVNCSAGVGACGSVVCNDGWTDSSVQYSDEIECEVTLQCTTQELEYYWSEYQVEQKASLITETQLELNETQYTLNQELIAIANQTIPLEFIIAQQNEARVRYKVQINTLESDLCERKYDYEVALYSVSRMCSENILTSTPYLDTSYPRGCAGPNSYLNQGDCYCDDGYLMDSRRICVSLIPETGCAGPNSYMDLGECYCAKGYLKDNSGVCQLALYAYPELIDSYIDLNSEMNSSENVQETNQINIRIGFDVWSTREKENFRFFNRSLFERIKGRILLQVEQNGEAWYVDPVSERRYYMKDGPTAYQMMRRFGLGITNSDLLKIPTEDSNSPGDVGLIERLKGRILLQVEQNGEAWYVDPVNGRRYYLKNGAEAYRIMRELSLGITDGDLSQLVVGTEDDIK